MSRYGIWLLGMLILVGCPTKTSKLNEGPVVNGKPEFDTSIQQIQPGNNIRFAGFNKSVYREKTSIKPYRLPIKEIQVSSTMPETDGAPFYKENLIDGDISTPWVSLAPRKQWINLTFHHPVIIKALGIANGYQLIHPQAGDLFVQNAKIAEASVSGNDGKKQILLLDSNDRGMKRFDLKPIQTIELRLSIDSLHKGRRWQDLNVGEIEVFGHYLTAGNQEKRQTASEKREIEVNSQGKNEKIEVSELANSRRYWAMRIWHNGSLQSQIAFDIGRTENMAGELAEENPTGDSTITFDWQTPIRPNIRLFGSHGFPSLQFYEVSAELTWRQNQAKKGKARLITLLYLHDKRLGLAGQYLQALYKGEARHTLKALFPKDKGGVYGQITLWRIAEKEIKALIFKWTGNRFIPLSLEEDALNQSYWGLKKCDYIDGTAFPLKAAWLIQTLKERQMTYHRVLHQGKEYLLVYAFTGREIDAAECAALPLTKAAKGNRLVESEWADICPNPNGLAPNG